MKSLLGALIFSFGFIALAQPALITNSLVNACGLSGPTYRFITSHLREKSVSQFPMKSKGPESGRRLYFFSDRSWFLTLEFLSESDLSKDVSCVVAHGPGETSQQALDFVLNKYPTWKWGVRPDSWPPPLASTDVQW